MKDFLRQYLKNKRTIILGYGREGKSTLGLLSEYFPELPLAVADKNEELLPGNPELQRAGITTFAGKRYLESLNDFDIVIKSPGISVFHLGLTGIQPKITSQTDLFLQAFAEQTIGISGTKGKSTTASLLYHIINGYNQNTILAGNIGIPLFDRVAQLDADTRVICEFSSHQLEFIEKAPAISILLNLYQEHLDHYASFHDYQLAKFQIALKQQPDNSFLYNPEDANIQALLREFVVPGIKVPVNTVSFSGDGTGRSSDGQIVFRKDGQDYFLLPESPETRLMGAHNLRNIISAATAALISGIPVQAIEEGIATFEPLKHRLEFLGTHGGRHYYDDSISTIPEASLAAIETLGEVNALILGGFDRDIDYEAFILKLCSDKIGHVVFTGPAGERMMKLLQRAKCKRPTFEMGKSFDDAVQKAVTATPINGVCLLSPAASSYDSFKDFEERGSRFKALVLRK